jgi:hypothetical protein
MFSFLIHIIGTPVSSCHLPDTPRNTTVTMANFPTQIRAGHLSNTNQKHFIASASLLDAPDRCIPEEACTKRFS